MAWGIAAAALVVGALSAVRQPLLVVTVARRYAVVVPAVVGVRRLLRHQRAEHPVA
ncbi:hypothetical protein [Dactylosporangium fulvum]|uniref:Uncharacterized protein n=1 Tax=Dactylosporangium fulvum TaxID=53359 RepID=A0ABY5W6G5_9ACTN|nr:hypothetical protein [Dactylosporangium fulvum]UWP85672.1 hypothetical protein Dfulv_16085 [Dactylosporangium fulvum]